MAEKDPSSAPVPRGGPKPTEAPDKGKEVYETMRKRLNEAIRPSVEGMISNPGSMLNGRVREVAVVLDHLRTITDGVAPFRARLEATETVLSSLSRGILFREIGYDFCSEMTTYLNTYFNSIIINSIN